MKAVILAAGVGKRLAPLTQHRPKCLIEIGGRSLLIRSLDALLAAGIHTVILVVGYQQELIRAAVGDHYRGAAIHYLVNEEYRRGSLCSVWLARTAFDDAVLIMDADVLYPPSFLTKLIASPAPNAILVDETVRQQSEEMMAVIRGGRVVALTKTPAALSGPAPDFLGEGIGFLKVSRQDSAALVAAMEPFIKRGELDMEYEYTWDAFFQAVPVGYETVGGQPWIEIDFLEDVERAATEVLPKIAAAS